MSDRQEGELYWPYQLAGGGAGGEAGAGPGLASGGFASDIAAGRAPALTVSEVNRRVAALIKSDGLLPDVWVKGEVSNFRPHYSGHMYFTLKDGRSQLRCVMFRSAASRVRFALENGMQVVARGGVSVFERDGQYQLYCEELRAEGVGDLYLAFEQLKGRLAAEGLFDASRKRPLPAFPRRVCVVTSPTGAVVRDIINVGTRRFPKARIVVIPVQVQGPGAAAQIARAVSRASALRLADVVIVGRGGGSIEDLWPFNEEQVARAVAASAIPVISAVGHETDFTICDFAADMRAPTPSAAAELAFPDYGAMLGRLASARRLLKSALFRRLELEKARLDRFRRHRAFTRPLERVEMARMRLNMAADKLAAAVRALHGREQRRLEVLAARLDALSPLAVLARGYAIATDEATGRVLRSSGQARPGGEVRVRLHEGALRCSVVEALGAGEPRQ